MSLLDTLARHAAQRRQRVAQVRLASLVEAARNAPATIQFRQRRAAALKSTRGIA